MLHLLLILYIVEQLYLLVLKIQKYQTIFTHWGLDALQSPQLTLKYHVVVVLFWESKNNVYQCNKESERDIPRGKLMGTWSSILRKLYYDLLCDQQDDF